MESGKEYRVVIPEERFKIIKFRKSLLKPGIGSINQGLEGFEPKEVFGWLCEVSTRLEEKTHNGLPTDDEMAVLRKFEETLDYLVKGPDLEHPNGLYVGHLIADGEMTSMWMVYNPEIVNNKFQDYIKWKQYLRHFDYSITRDDTWSKILHLLD